MGTTEPINERLWYMVVYHLSHIENKESIQQNGIHANDEGQIFVFTDLIVAATIARNQVFCSRYVVFEIDIEGVQGEVWTDNVAELCYEYQLRISQKLIAPKSLRMVGEYDIYTEDYYRNYEHRGFTRQEMDQERENDKALFEASITERRRKSITKDFYRHTETGEIFIIERRRWDGVILGSCLAKKPLRDLQDYECVPDNNVKLSESSEKLILM